MASRAVRAESTVRSDVDPVRLLYAAAGLLLFVLMLVGFQQFYLHERAYPAHPFAPPIRTLLITHGVAMTLWVVTFLIQSRLIVGRNRRVHMAVGSVCGGSGAGHGVIRRTSVSP